MHILSLINIKTALICLVRDAISYSTPKHHLIATHIVVHAIFQLWHVSLLINQIKVDDFIRRNLNSNISFDEVDESFNSDLMINSPASFFGFSISLLLEK